MLSKAVVERIQILLTANNRYKGAIDGIPGTQTMLAVQTLLKSRYHHALKWGADRQMISAAQIMLRFAGYDPGITDGYWGNMTAGAFLEWNHKYHTGNELKLKYEPLKPAKPSPFPVQAKFDSFYGVPGIELEKKLVKVESPYDLRIDWSVGQITRTIRIHPKLAESLEKILWDIYIEYGVDKIRQLGLDRYAGSYSHRKMRGGSSWSTHAYGAAIDWYSGKNGLTTRCPQALFCKPEYSAFIDIWESHGWTSLGRAIGRDYMHFQAGAIK